MNQALIKIFLIVALLSAASCERWAVLLCGSNVMNNISKNKHFLQNVYKIYI